VQNGQEGERVPCPRPDKCLATKSPEKAAGLVRVPGAGCDAASDRTDQVKGEGKSRGTLKWSTCEAHGAPRVWGRAQQQRGELHRSERRVGGPHRVGGGRENGLIQKPPQLLTCARRSGAPGQACRKKSSCGGGGARSKEGRGTWPEGARPLAPPRQGERPMAGTVTTRKHVRTHAHATRSGQARARKPANPALPTPSLRPITKRRLT
jgi:hypothetical protein